MVVGGDAVREVGQWEMGRDSVEQELAEALPDFDLLALAVVGEYVGDDRHVVFIDDVVLGVGGGEDDGSTHGYPGAEKGGAVTSWLSTRALLTRWRAESAVTWRAV